MPPGSLINAVLSMVTSHGLIAPHCDGFEVSGLALNCIASKINLTFAPGNEWDLLNFFQMDYMHCDSANPWYYYEWIYRCWTRGIVWFDVRMSLVFSCRFYDSIFIVWSCPHAFIFLKKNRGTFLHGTLLCWLHRSRNQKFASVLRSTLFKRCLYQIRVFLLQFIEFSI